MAGLGVRVLQDGNPGPRRRRATSLQVGRRLPDTQGLLIPRFPQKERNSKASFPPGLPLFG